MSATRAWPSTGRHASRVEGGDGRRRYGVARGEEAEHPLVGADLLGGDLAPEQEIDAADAPVGTFELQARLAEPIPSQVSA
ncbi:MAG: hypothetical protein H0T86_00535 [Gemmatimonadales bacterium]|nr:hypothetical protein [Gemmatimonadales bacterium]